MNKEKITVLRWFDIVILTIILIGQGIVNSTRSEERRVGKEC